MPSSIAPVSAICSKDASLKSCLLKALSLSAIRSGAPDKAPSREPPRNEVGRIEAESSMDSPKSNSGSPVAPSSVLSELPSRLEKGAWSGSFSELSESTARSAPSSDFVPEASPRFSPDGRSKSVKSRIGSLCFMDAWGSVTSPLRCSIASVSGKRVLFPDIRDVSSHAVVT